MTESSDSEVARFAAELRQLRNAAGRPSLRKMSQMVHYSHTALGSVQAGKKLSSLDLTLAFVRGCGGNEDEWRERWEQVSAAVKTEPPARPSRPSRRREWPHTAGAAAGGRPAVVLGAALAAAAILLLGIRLGTWMGAHHAHGKTAAHASRVAPRPRTNGPLVPGDRSAFVSDVTFPDGSPVHVRQRFTKVWELRDTGSVTWAGRYLSRQTPQEPGVCSSPSRVPIPSTRPGQDVKISVTLTAPDRPGSCRVDWKMTNARGALFFPGLSSIYVIVNVIP